MKLLNVTDYVEALSETSVVRYQVVDSRMRREVSRDWKPSSYLSVCSYRRAIFLEVAIDQKSVMVVCC